jgi:hypothetical protein
MIVESTRVDRALFDTGADISLIEKALFDQIPTLRPIEKDAAAPTVTGVGNGRTIVHGWTRGDIGFDGYIFNHPLLVVSGLPNPLIVGADFLRQHHCTISFGTKDTVVPDRTTCSQIY